ncbi:MAG TPA: hypothetical protein PKI20_14235 [Verrucomicrobiota bacterium]|nr:hypothetical protein [Verrucomicrobiota bacterium]HQL77628.1 hypothetical protein [Verrucomicrobiota bacterium]
MHSNIELASFAARLRRAIVRGQGAPEWGGGVVPAFDHLALELFALQFEHNAPYRRFCEARRARPDTVADWTGIPAVPTSAFKAWQLSCLPVEARIAVFHSSGTTGQAPSRHFHNAASLALYEASLLAWFKAHLPSAVGPCSLVVLTPPPARAPHSSLVHMFETLRRALSFADAPFVGQVAEDGGWSLDVDAALELMRKAIAGAQPVLLLGTAFSFVHLLDHLADRGRRFELPAGSCAMETGGYKGRSRALPKAALHALISERFGIQPDRIICEYGMSELSSQAYDRVIPPPRTALGIPDFTQSAARVFRFPPWARVQIISPETGAEAGAGETGLIRVFDLANAYSVLAVQTEDLGIRRGDGFELAGRAALAEPRGCSLMAV